MAREVVQANGHEAERHVRVLGERTQRHDRDARLQRQQLSSVVASTFRKDSDRLASIERLVHRIKHGRLVDMRVDAVRCVAPGLSRSCRRHGRGRHP